MSGRVLVTGGAGFIGSHLVDALLAKGETVTVFDDFSSGSRDNLADAEAMGRLRVLSGTILDPEAVSAAMEGCDRVYHLAVQCVRRSLGNPRQSHDVNATGSFVVLEEARRHGIRRFVYCSSSEVYGNGTPGLLNETTTLCRPVTAYGAAKLAGELYADAYYQTYNLPVVIVRPFNAYGPRAHVTGDLAEVVPRFVIRALSGLEPVIFGDGSNGRDFTYVTDVARGIAMAGETDLLVGSRINIAYGNMITVREVAEIIMKVCGRNDMAAAFSRPRPGDVHVLHADTQRAVELLSYRAEIPFDVGISRYVDWFSRQYPDPSALLDEQVENWLMPASRQSPL
jgi:UDP-glucose 4-epimerase